MPKDEFTLPTGEKVILIYGARHPGKGTRYLNAVRIRPVDEASDMALEYRSMEKFYARELAKLVELGAPTFDAVVSPPSSRRDAEPYRQATPRDRLTVTPVTPPLRTSGLILLTCSWIAAGRLPSAPGPRP
jgi:hypothetical protein